MNYSGSTATREAKQIEEIQIEVKEEEPVEDTPQEFTIEDKETQRIMSLYESTRLQNPELFNALMKYNKEMLEIVSKETSTHQDIKRLEDLFRKVEVINDDFTFWIVIRGIKTSILETKNLDIVHFFLVK